ncbi:DUF6240 domain-containing protein [Tepidibacter thalassicus]|uniref:Hook-length control protein FliK n=1 Tax=Tepidibacter thalassicus DSM 15285 TaxID=1123350 RepID=A0A1M5R4Q8_9FIRM|nr:DUF6240 domain-containing protein [Tepidibacter thalassicus]SHH21096.1 hook-length control protein FliK [Tepidibacter thalassicus DSM 15285]
MLDKVSREIAYNTVSDKYTAFNASFKIRGTLIENNEDEVKIDVGDNKVIEAKLKEKIDAKVGDTVVIDKKNIISSKIVDTSREIKVDKDEIVKYSDILKKLDVEVNEENLNAVKALNIHGIKLTRENIMSFVYSKNYLDEIIGNLDYDSAVKLLDRNVDIENDSLQKISSVLDEIKNEKEGFSFLNIFKKKKELTTDEAEQIAEKIYGSKMGKDITDIIKVLYKRNVSITKKNIERVNDIFYKLDKLSDIKDETFIDTVKNKVDVTIDNLYKIKSFIKKGVVQVVDKVSDISTKAYEKFLPKVNRVTEKDLKLLEEDIKSLLKDMDINVDENITLAKKFIKNGLEVTKENIQNIKEMKEALNYIIKNLDCDKVAVLIKSKIDVEKVDIRELANEIKNIENIKIEVNTEDKEVEDILKKIDTLKKVSEKDLLTLLKKNIDFKISKIEKVILKTEQKTISNINDIIYEPKHVEQNRNILNGKIQSILENSNTLQKSENKYLVEILKNNKEVIINSTNENMLNNEQNQNSDLLNSSISSINKLTKIFSEIKNLDFNIISFQIKNKIPMTLNNIHNSYLLLNNKTDNIKNTNKKIEMPKNFDSKHESIVKKYVKDNISAFDVKKENIKEFNQAVSVAKALIQNSLNLSKINIQRVYEAYGQFKYIKDNLTSKIVKDSIVKGLKIEDMKLDNLSKYIKEFKNDIDKSQVKINNSLKIFIDNINSINREKESSIAFIMKNNRNMSLKEIEKTSLFFKNKNQIGHKIADVIKFLEDRDDRISKENIFKLKQTVKKISKHIKKGNLEPKKVYEDISNTLKDIQHNVKSDDEISKTINKKCEDLMETLEKSYVFNKDEKILQFPIFINEQFSNLNMYFRDRKKSGKKMNKDNMDVILSLDTANLGNINIYLGVNKNNLSIKMSVNNIENKNHIENHIELLKNLLEDTGYNLDDISFEVDNENIIDISKEKEKDIISRGFLDVKI